MAEFLFRDLATKNGLLHELQIASAATSREELGNPPHPGTRAKLACAGISTHGKTAVQMTCQDYHYYDYIFGMDRMNIKNILRITGGDPDGKVFRLLDLTNHPRDIADPWYTGNFETTYQDILEGCNALLKKLQEEIQ